MNHPLSAMQKSCRLSLKTLLILSGIVAVNGLGMGAMPAGALEAKQATPTLRGLLETIPVRPSERAPNVLPSEPSGTVSGESEPAVTEGEEEVVSLKLHLSERRLDVYRGDSVETSYPVAVGRPGWETPTGEFEVFHQIKDPGWTNPLTSEQMPPGPDNPLGDRWIAFWTDGTNLIGFHGTPNRESVGQAASHGCIRMYNEDVRELYDIVSVGTPVVVVQ